MELTITIANAPEREALFGPANRTLRIIRDQLKISLVAREQNLRISGRPKAVAQAAAAIELLRKKARSGVFVNKTDVLEAVTAAAESPSPHKPSKAKTKKTPKTEELIEVYPRGRYVSPRTAGQAQYVKAITEKDMVFCTGPAGTGKTYLAVAMAVAALKQPHPLSRAEESRSPRFR